MRTGFSSEGTSAGLPPTEETGDLDQEQIQSLIGDIYDAALEPERWPATLGRISDAVGAAATGLAILDGAANCRHLLSWGIPSDFKQRFFAEFSAADSNPAAAAAASQEVGVPATLPHTAGWDQFLSSQLYQELYRPIGLWHPVVVILAKGPTYNIGFAPQLPDKKEGLEPDEYQRLMALIPHVQRAVGVFLRFGALVEQNRLLAEALDSVGTAGVVLVDATGAVILANRTAEEIARERDGLAFCHNGISAANSDLTRQLERAIASAVLNSVGQGFNAGGAVRLTRPSGRRPLLAVVSPVGRTEWTLLPRRPAALVFICDPERELVLPPERLSQLFALTPREAQIAAFLAQGASLSEAAERFGLSRATVQTHLKRILDKTGTHRQAELVSVLLRSLLGLAQSQPRSETSGFNGIDALRWG